MVRLRKEHRLSRAGAAARIGVSLKVLEHWEKHHNNAKPEMLPRWAAAYGQRLAISWSAADAGPADHELIAAIQQLSAEERELMHRFMRAYQSADTRGQLYLRGAVSAEEQAGTLETSSPQDASSNSKR